MKKLYYRQMESQRKAAKFLKNISRVLTPTLALAWYKPTTVYIFYKAKAAIANHNRFFSNNDHLAIYTDWNDAQNKIGVSTVTIFTLEKKESCLGSNQKFIVYFEKLYGLWMALELIVEDKKGPKIFIFTDNQAAIFFLK